MRASGFVPSNNLVSVAKINTNSLQLTSNGIMSIYYQNVRGLRTKTSEVLSNSRALDKDIFLLTETWLHPGINSLELFDCSFTVFRKDRHESNSSLGSSSFPKGGGVLIAIKNNYKSTQIFSEDFNFLELITIKIDLDFKNLFISCIYFPPKSSFQNYLDFLCVLEFIVSISSPRDELLIFGDFNLPNIDWISHDEECFLIPSGVLNDNTHNFIDGLNLFNLQQISGVKNHQNRQLDLIFTSDWVNSTTIDSNLTLSKTDLFHPPISLKYSYIRKYEATTDELGNYNFHKANFLGLNDYINSMDFASLFCTEDVNLAVKLFYDTILAGIEQFVPKSQLKSSSFTPPWLSTDLKKIRNKKNKAWNKYLRDESLENYCNFTSLFNFYKEECEVNYNNYLVSMAAELKRSPKTFWKFVNSKRKCDQYPSTMSYNDQSSKDSSDICAFFRDFFSTSYDLKSEEAIDIGVCNSESKIPPIVINENVIINYINKLNNDSKPGPDNIPNIVLKMCYTALAPSISYLFNLSLKTGVFPDIWKKSFIRPIHKKDSKSNISNYRPISKLSSIPKLFELIIYDSIYESCTKIISKFQHGFMKKRSTVTNLLECQSHYIKSMESGYQTDVIYTDFSKAFDLLPHNVITLKLRNAGFPEYLISWFNSYLRNRSYSVIFRSKSSLPFHTNAGVPQGSHLGPLLFIIAINDVMTIIKHSCICIYADDMKIYKEIKSMDDVSLLQDDLDSFMIWCKENCLVLNVKKCALMSYSKRLNPILNSYVLDNEIINRVSKFNDFGVLLDEKLTFELHFNRILNKANSMLGFVKRWAKEFDDPYVIKSLYISLVRPNLEYASQIWSPYYICHIKRIEAIQKNFLRFSLRKLNWENPMILPPYNNRLKLIDLKSLEARRIIADITFLFQVYNGLIDSSFVKNLIDSNLNSRNRFRCEKIFVTALHRTNYGKYQPINRMFMEVNNFQSVLDLTFSKVQIFTALSKLLN